MFQFMNKPIYVLIPHLRDSGCFHFSPMMLRPIILVASLSTSARDSLEWMFRNEIAES